MMGVTEEAAGGARCPIMLRSEIDMVPVYAAEMGGAGFTVQRKYHPPWQ